MKWDTIHNTISTMQKNTWNLCRDTASLFTDIPLCGTTNLQQLPIWLIGRAWTKEELLRVLEDHIKDRCFSLGTLGCPDSSEDIDTL